jgi:hypothetical protein
MAKVVFEDDCLTPDRTIRIDFKGPNPFRFYSEIIMILRDILEIRRLDIYEREFRWEIQSDPRPFFYRVWARKPYDAYTDAYVELIFQGKQPTDITKDGEMVIFITAKIRTSMPEDTVWQRSSLYKGLRWLYFRLFYNDARRILLNKCIHHIELIEERLRKVLGITPPIQT